MILRGEHNLSHFLVADPNGFIGPIDPKTNPVILTTDEEVDVWLRAPAWEALQLPRPPATTRFSDPIRCGA
jgi:putative SOS response-associated peptidase YedK